MPQLRKKYVAVDAGKFNTKVNAYDAGINKQLRTKFRTKMSEGTFDDDMFERGTFIVQVDDGPVYKVGWDARKEPDLETSKKSEIHRICTMTAIALACCDGEHKGINVAIGIPYDICVIPKERLEYKAFILGEPGMMHKVRLKAECRGPVHEVSFSFDKQLVYPEGIGVLYQYPEHLDGPTGIIDIGNLNTNNLYCDSFQIAHEGCFSDELGGKVMITNLASVLTADLGARANEGIVASTLLKPVELRALKTKNGDKEKEKRSKEIIDAYLLEHVKTIRQKCDSRHWPLEFMNLVCMGGTARLLKNEIYQVFGNETFIPDDPEYVNVMGFLKKLCADDGIDLFSIEKKEEEQKEMSA